MSIVSVAGQVRAIVDGEPVTGAVEGFRYDVPALVCGEPGDIALVRTEAGRLLAIPVAELTSVAAPGEQVPSCLT